jgi:hypothetical protein
VEFSGPTFHIGEYDTGFFDPTYDMCSCESSEAFDTIAACTAIECVDAEPEQDRLSQATKDAIISSINSSCNLECFIHANDISRRDNGLGNNGHFYKHVVGNMLPWENAGAAANALTICDGAVKGHLATLTSEEENAFVFGLPDLPFNGFSWLAFSRAAGH